MKSIIFVFIINCILFIITILLCIISLRQSCKVAVYINNHLLSWDIDKNANVITTFKLTYSTINMCLLETNKKTERYEEKLLFPISTIDNAKVGRKEKRISKFDVKLFYHGMFYLILFFVLASMFLNSLDKYYKTDENYSKLTETLFSQKDRIHSY